MKKNYPTGMRFFLRQSARNIFMHLSAWCLLVSTLSCGIPVYAENPPIAVSAEAALLMEASTGEVIFCRRENERLPMASTTKIMTALVALEQGNPAMPVQITQEMVGAEGSSIYLSVGETLTLEELLYALLLESANDAATAIACAVGGSVPAFAALMNAKAAELGLENTHFTNPHGLDDPAHYTTALDLAKLAAAALQNPAFASIVSTYRKTIPLKDGEGVRLLLNHNRLLKQCQDVIGVKTGFTKKSGRCLVSAAARDGVELIAVTLNAPDDWQDHRAMLDYGFTCFQAVTLAECGQWVTEIPCTGTESGILTVANTASLQLVLHPHENVTHVIEGPRILFPPVEAGTEIARIRFFAGGREIASLPLCAMETVAAPPISKNWLERLLDF